MDVSQKELISIHLLFVAINQASGAERPVDVRLARTEAERRPALP